MYIPPAPAMAVLGLAIASLSQPASPAPSAPERKPSADPPPLSVAPVVIGERQRRRAALRKAAKQERQMARDEAMRNREWSRRMVSSEMKP